MNKIRIIIAREYWSRVRKRSFLLTTLIAPLGVAAFITVIYFVNVYSGSKKSVAVVDQSGHFDFEKRALKTPSDKSLVFVYPDGPVEELENLEQSEYDALVVIPEGYDPFRPNRSNIRVVSQKRIGTSNRDWLERVITDQVRHLKMARYEIDAAVVDDFSERVEPYYTVLGEEEEKTGFADMATLIGMLMGFAVYMSLFLYGMMVMRGVMEEKTNRIVEVIASSVKPFQLLISKIIAIGGVSLTQYLLWGVLIFLVQLVLGTVLGVQGSEMGTLGGSMEASGMDEDTIDDIMALFAEFNFAKIGGIFILYFLGGYLLYGALFAAIGSAVNEDGDLQSLTWPVTIPIVISIMLMMVLINDPDGRLAFWASMIPLSSPICMPARIAFEVPTWQILLSLTLLVGGFLGTTWIAARVYRTGILMYGKKVTLKELGRWLVYQN